MPAGSTASASRDTRPSQTWLPGGGDTVEQRLAERLRWVAAARIGVLTLLAVATFAAFHESPRAPTPRTLLSAISLGLLASATYFLWLRARRALVALGLVQILGDLLLWCLVVSLTGGAESTFSVLFHLSVLVSAFLFGSRGAAITAGSGVVLFGATALMLRGGLITPPSDLVAVTTLSLREVVYYLGVNTAGLGVVAALSGFLAERERRAGGQLEEARRTSADLAALNDDIVRSLTSGLAATDEDGIILWVNPAGADILGRGPGELVGRPLRELVPVDRSPTDSRSAGRDEARVLLPSGERAHLGFRLAPLLAGDGSVLGSLLVFQDLTELSTMREKVERSERLAGLGRLAAAMAHEIRNPLGSISGSLELLKETARLDADDRRLADIVLREVDRLSGLVTQMLEVARPRQPSRTDTDLVAMAQEVARVIGSSAEAEDLEIQLELPPKLVASVDAAQVRQLLWNLLRNAAQASPPGGVVRLRLAGAEGNVVIEVADSGDGVDPSDRERIFEPFFSTKAGGIGMGLVVCRQVATGHGGTIGVDATPAGGAVFTVQLPAAEG